MKIVTERLVLRDLKKTDTKDILKHANNVNIARFIPPFPHPYTLKDAKWFVNECIKDASKKPRLNYQLGITIKGSDEVVGMISIHEHDVFQEKSMIGYWLSETHWRKGYMEEALREIIKFGFAKLKLRRIDINAFADNVGSNALIKKVGFRYEGTRIKELKDKATGQIHDHHLYGMLREDWKPHL